MTESIDIVFCADRRVLPGLHVAAYSVVANHLDSHSTIQLHIISDDLNESDLDLLKKTLVGAKNAFTLTAHCVSNRQFLQFPSMSGSWSAYFRLLAPQMIAAERIIYLDVDTVCYLDVSEFTRLDLGDHPAGFVAETTIRASPDRSVANRLPHDGDKPLFNSGVMVVNRKLWQERQVTERSMEYLQSGDACRWDQSALNIVLVDDWKHLDARFNFISNWRHNWPLLRGDSRLQGKVIHFLDNPKPWDFLAECVHPHFRLWRSTLEKTEMKRFRSWHATPSRKFPKTQKAWNGYKKALKDCFLFKGYSRGWFNNVKGVPSV